MLAWFIVTARKPVQGKGFQLRLEQVHVDRKWLKDAGEDQQHWDGEREWGGKKDENSIMKKKKSDTIYGGLVIQMASS